MRFTKFPIHWIAVIILHCVFLDQTEMTDCVWGFLADVLYMLDKYCSESLIQCMLESVLEVVLIFALRFAHT